MLLKRSNKILALCRLGENLMSKIFKKSLSVILAVVLCVSAMAGCLTSFAATYTANQATHRVTATSVDASGKNTATINVNSATSTANLGAVLLDVAVPGVPITAIAETTGKFDITTTPSISSGTIKGATSLRILLVSKVTGTNYNAATVTISFDTSAKSLVESGIDPDSGAILDVVVWGASAACYGSVNDSTEPENVIAVLVAENAAVNDGGKAHAPFTIRNTCTHSYTSEITKDSTCTELGVKTYTCSLCGRQYTEDVAMKEHAYDGGVVNLEPTCANVGNRVYTCEDCGATRNESIAATGNHVYPTVYEGNEDNWIVDEGDCFTTVYAHPKCLTCGVADMSDEAAYEVGLGAHSWEEMGVIQEKTCTQDGITSVMCWNCGEESTVVEEATGHVVNGDVTTVEPTCGADGSKSYVCGACGETVVETLPATGDHAWNDGIVTKDPTCTEAGVLTYTCGTCGETKTEAIEASGEHAWDDGVVTKDPTCTEAGVRTYTCGACGETKTEAIEASGEHTKAAAVYENNETTGNYDAVVKCADCGEDITRVLTDVPNNTTVNSAITTTSYVFVTDSVGIMTMLTKSQLTSYSKYTIRAARVAIDTSYNFTYEYDEATEFITSGKRMVYNVNSNVALFEMALPMALTVCGYDASGNLVSVSAPYITTITDELWKNYQTLTDDVDKTFYLDLVNMGSAAQNYFVDTYGGADCDLATAVFPKDMYAFDQSYASESAPTYDSASLPNITTPSTAVSVGGKSTRIMLKTLNLAGAAPTLQYVVQRGAIVADPSLWRVDFEYASASGSTITKSLNGVATEGDAMLISGNHSYALFAPSLYDSDKSVSAKFYYNDTLIFEDLYSVDTWLDATLKTATGSTATLVDAIAKFGVSARTYFSKQA